MLHLKHRDVSTLLNSSHFQSDSLYKGAKLVARLKEHNPGFKSSQSDVAKHLLKNVNHQIDFNHLMFLATAQFWKYC